MVAQLHSSHANGYRAGSALRINRFFPSTRQTSQSRNVIIDPGVTSILHRDLQRLEAMIWNLAPFRQFGSGLGDLDILMVDLNTHKESQPSTAPSSHASAQSANSTQSRLLQLPPELRNHIYEFVLPKLLKMSSIKPGSRQGARRQLMLHSEHHDGPSRPVKPQPVTIPALLQTCQLLRADALPKYFAENIFLLVLDNKDGAYKYTIKWLECTDARGLYYLKRPLIHCDVERVHGYKYFRYAFTTRVNASLPTKSSRVGVIRHETPFQGPDDRFAVAAQAIRDFARNRAIFQPSQEEHKANWIKLARDVHDVLQMSPTERVQKIWLETAARMRASRMGKVVAGVSTRRNCFVLGAMLASMVALAVMGTVLMVKRRHMAAAKSSPVNATECSLGATGLYSANVILMG
ncbi:hypothetical protein LTR56_005431 [Elasticomyces elasticus]|nr:hypothetical protein LTR56_005431 [Elasticomyces elasticus]KAK4927817.1 hypothetical protein LTR49_005443 [Elasticomyces elasticus]KAK5750885.1 hypothetical protein LTS12_019028 [Elasticomyces elasticus]